MKLLLKMHYQLASFIRSMLVEASLTLPRLYLEINEQKQYACSIDFKRFVCYN